MDTNEDNIMKPTKRFWEEEEEEAGDGNVVEGELAQGAQYTRVWNVTMKSPCVIVYDKSKIKKELSFWCRTIT